MNRIRQIIASGAAVTTLAVASIGSASALTPVPKTLVLSNANNGQTVHMQAGEALALRLSSVSWTSNAVPAGQTKTSSSPWMGLNSSNNNVLDPFNAARVTKQTNSDGSTTNTSARNFKTVMSGTANIDATSIVSQVCSIGTACSEQLSLSHFHVTVVVDPSTVCVPQPGYVCPE